MKNSDFIQNDIASNSSSMLKYVRLIWRWAWLVLLAGIIAGAAAYFGPSFFTPTYETSIQLFVSVPSRPSYLTEASMFSSTYMTSTYSQMITDYPVLQEVIDQLNLNMPVEDLRESISISEVERTQLIDITVKGTDPNLIVSIANTLGEVFSQRISDLQSARYTASKEALSEQVAEMDVLIENTTQELAQVTDLNQRPQIEARLAEYKQLYANLVSSFEEVRMAEAEATTNVLVSDPAVYVDPVGLSPVVSSILGFTSGVTLAIGGIIVIDLLDDSITDPEQIQQKFNIPVLGTITKYKITKGKVISQDQPRSPTTESYRSLRTNLLYASADKSLKRIIVTSPVPHEGKTTIASNLGVVLAQIGKKVSVVDADFRCPALHSQFGIENNYGLSQLFDIELDDIGEYTQTSQIQGLTIITSGPLPFDPTELLASSKMINILDHLSIDNQFVLIDTPPVLNVSESSALAAEMDGVIVVVKAGSTKMALLKQTIDQLRGVRAEILGVVLNHVKVKGYQNRYDYKYHPERKKTFDLRKIGEKLGNVVSNGNE
jgi:non-specific protein-tyrosine kinase